MANKAGLSPIVDLAAIARFPFRVSGSRIDFEMLKTIGLLCGIGLALLWLLVITGLELSIGFF